METPDDLKLDVETPDVDEAGDEEESEQEALDAAFPDDEDGSGEEDDADAGEEEAEDVSSEEGEEAEGEEEEEAAAAPATFKVGEYEYDESTLEYAVQQALEFQEINKQFISDPVSFITGNASKLEADDLKELAVHFAKQSGLELVDEDGELYDHKPNEARAATRKLKQTEAELEELKQAANQQAIQTERNAAITAMKLTYGKADQAKQTHPVNIADRIYREERGRRPYKQVLSSVLAELNSNGKLTEEAKMKKKTKAKPTPPPVLDDDSDFDDGAAFMKWQRSRQG